MGISVAVYETVNELESSNIPLLEKEGWLRHQSKVRSHRKAADGVVGSAKSSGLNNFAELTTPAALFRNGSILLIAQPPLLFKEGNVAHCNSFTPVTKIPLSSRLLKSSRRIPRLVIVDKAKRLCVLSEFRLSTSVSVPHKGLR